MGPASAIAVILVLVGLAPRAAAAPARRPRRVRQPAGRGVTWRPADADTTRRPRRGRPARQHRGRRQLRRNWLGGLAGWLWLAVVIIPIYWIVITSFKSQSDYFADEPARAADATRRSTTTGSSSQSDFLRYFVNSVIVTRRRGRPGGARLVHGGVRDRPRRRQPVPAVGQRAVPDGPGDPAAGDDHPRLPDHHQAAGCTTRLLAIILPSIAFAIPLSVLVLSNFIRDVPEGAVRVDAARRRHRVGHAVAPGVPADPAGARHRGDLQRPDRSGTASCCRWSSPRARTSARCRWRCGPSRASTASTSRPCWPRSCSPRCRSSSSTWSAAASCCPA